MRVARLGVQGCRQVVLERRQAALRAQASRLRAHVEAHPEQRLVDIAHSLVTTRTAFDVRAVVVAKTREELVAQLSRVTAAEPGGKLAVFFSGQGSQRPEMSHRPRATRSSASGPGGPPGPNVLHRTGKLYSESLIQG